MCLFVTSLNSGSNGNCYYVGTRQSAVLIDAGISCREIERRMKRLELEIAAIRAIFISHEHSDHIKGIESLSRKYQIPVFMTAATFKNTDLDLDDHLRVFFAPEASIPVGALRVTSFSKFHDAAEPISFVVDYNDVRVGIFTDIGHVCEKVRFHFSSCHAAFLETNYDEKMLREGRYPVHLKQRIRGKFGHLSNHQALELFLEHRAPYMSHLFLSHLSENNNHPRVVADTFGPHAGNVRVVIAPRDRETAVYEISGHGERVPPPVSRSRPVQLSIFTQ